MTPLRKQALFCAAVTAVFFVENLIHSNYDGFGFWFWAGASLFAETLDIALRQLGKQSPPA